MPKNIFLFYSFILCMLHSTAFTQTIQGEILGMDDHQSLTEVKIENVFNSRNTVSDISGKFLIAADKGELLEFKKSGYKTVRVRIPQSYIPSYFKIIMEKGSSDIQQLYVANDWKSDSTHTHDIYKHELDFPTMSTMDMIQHPFSAMSKHNQEIWAFQKEYDYMERQKYVDYSFSPKLISNLTGLQGDSLQSYIRRYRPTYEQARSMNEYTMYSYIRKTVGRYRHGYSNSRNSR